MQVFKILSATAVKLHFTKKVRNSCSGAQNFETCLGTCFKASGSRLPPYLLSFFNWFCGQTIGMWGSDGRIEPIYFDYKFSELTIFLADFLGSPGSVRLLRAAGDRFYDKKIYFLRAKSGLRESRVRRRFWESRVRRRKPGNLE